MDTSFLIHSFFLGLGLSADAFSLALVNGLKLKKPDVRYSIKTVGIFAAFQTLMPLFGWYFVRGLLGCFQKAEKLMPLIAFTLLLITGIKMLLGSENNKAGTGNLIAQGFASSLDALSVGFGLGKVKLQKAVLASTIIGGVTLLSCMAAFKIGRQLGERFGRRAQYAGAGILIFLGFEILFKGSI